jgi:hypothetical protein
MPDSRFHIVTAEQDLERVQEANSRVRYEWPEFMLHDKASALFPDLYQKVPAYQFVVVEPDSGDTVAIGNSVPLEYRRPVDELPVTGWDWVIQKGIDDFDHQRHVNLLCALQIVVFSKYRGKGISQHGVQAMRRVGHDRGLECLIAPVRPSAKCDHPHVSIHEYITWKNADGLPQDPWLRVHARAGARIVKPCENAMEIVGTAAEWKEWTGIKFEKSGEYLVPQALVPVTYDADQDVVRYLEPNVWMVHSPVGQ